MATPMIAADTANPGRGHLVLSRIYVDAAGRAVPEGDPGAVSLIATPGRRLDDARARALGLTGGPDGEPEPAEVKPAPETAELPPAETKPAPKPARKAR